MTFGRRLPRSPLSSVRRAIGAPSWPGLFNPDVYTPGAYVTLGPANIDPRFFTDGQETTLSISAGYDGSSYFTVYQEESYLHSCYIGFNAGFWGVSTIAGYYSNAVPVLIPPGEDCYMYLNFIGKTFFVQNSLGIVAFPIDGDWSDSIADNIQIGHDAGIWPYPYGTFANPGPWPP